MVNASRQPSSRRPVGVRIPNPRSPASAQQGDNVRHLYVWRGIALAVELFGIWWKGRDSNPRPRHYELGSWLKLACKFNNLPRGARCNWHHEAQLSTTDSRRTPAEIGVMSVPTT